MSTPKSVEGIARSYAHELIRLGDGLCERAGVAPALRRPAGASPVDHALAMIDLLAYERRILGQARRVLDRVADHLHDPALRRAAGGMAQAIVDEIGHAVTDEPALGQSYREQLAKVQEWLDACPMPSGWRP
ncbi:hypothetical protein [Micromonospora sp. NPDC047730]|uniref:hypothetical protein n=1 Tax=Micromonospora sp. NPDC047730 TaxID=3364253 RepID=UPI003710767E